MTLTITDDTGATDTSVQTVTVVQRSTVTTYTGATTGDYHDSVTLGATLVDGATSDPLANETVSFTLGTQSCSGTTDVSGAASCTLDADAGARLVHGHRELRRRLRLRA